LNANALTTTPSFIVAGYRVEPAVLRVVGAEHTARLEAKAMQVLIYLAENKGRVVSRLELEQRLWPGRVVTEDAVTNAVAKLRRAFRDDPRNPGVIETIPKSGYRLIAPVATSRDNDTGCVDRVGTGRRRSRRLIWTVALLVSVLIGLDLVLQPRTPPSRVGGGTGRPAVAVLPFENLGVRPSQDYFANGVTADLITDLSKVSGLLVIAPGSVFPYRDSEARPGQVSADLAVDFVVMGSVQRAGDRLRVNVQLIGAQDELALWGERYEGNPADLFEVQDQIAADLIAALRVELAPSERDLLARRPTESLAAYDHYLRGLEAHGHRYRDQNLEAMEHFRSAVALDPSFARAYAGLALAYSREAIDGWTPTPSRSLELASELAEKAAAADPTLPQVHFVSGQVALFRRRHGRALEAAQQAIRVDPNYADAYALSAWTLNYAGRPGEAESALTRAMRLNPRPPASYLEILGEIRFVQGRYAESAATFERVLSVNPTYSRARMWGTAALALAGARDQAQWEAIELQAVSPGFSLSRLRFAFPFKDPRALDAVLDGLRKAGLPDGPMPRDAGRAGPRP
jgi:TolB-like protein/DNA-binding winged helix-turn-helix (wHTH) protein/Tfp pilus assembly protein PilF